MNPPERVGGRYPSFVPPTMGVGDSGEGRDFISRRKVIVDFHIGRHPDTCIEGTVRLRGPLNPLTQTINDQVPIQNIPNPNNPRQVHRAAVFDEADGHQITTGLYVLTVTITGPDCLRRRDPEGTYHNRIYDRKVWIDYEVIELETSTERTIYRRIAVISGDPTSLEFAYLSQFANSFPHYMQSLEINQRTGRPGQGLDARLSAQFGKYLGAVKKRMGHLGLMRNAYRLASASRPVSQLLGVPRCDPVSQRLFRHWTALEYIQTREAHVALNRVRYEDLIRRGRGELLLINQWDIPRTGRLRAIRALDYFGKVLDVLEIGNNALRYHERTRAGFQAERLFNDELDALERNQAFSIMRQVQIANIHSIAVRRASEALAMLGTLPISLIGFIPVAGWLTAATVGLLSAALSAGENRIHAWLTDILDDNANALLLRTQHYDMMVAGQTYDQLFPSERAKMLVQYVIRAKLLYDLHELVNGRNDAGHRRRIETLAAWITQNGIWHIHRDVVFRCESSYGNSFRYLQPYSRERDRGSEWIRVHFQDYFPIDCWCDNPQQFRTWFNESNQPSVSLFIPNGDLDRSSMTWEGIYQGRIRNFNIFRFPDRLHTYIFLLTGSFQEDCDRIFAGQDIIPSRRQPRPLGTAIKNTIERIISCGANITEIIEASGRHHRLSIIPDLRRSTITNDITFHFRSKCYIMLLSGESHSAEEAILNRLYLITPPQEDELRECAPEVYEIKGSSLHREGRTTRFM